jgi:hypothetical protein
VIRTACDHSEVDVLATRGVSPAGEEKIQVLLVNRMPREVELSPLRVRLPSGWADTAVRTERRRYADGDREPMLVEPKSAGTEAAAEAGVIEYRESLPASSVVVITLVREARPGA